MLRLPDSDTHFIRFIGNGKQYHGHEIELSCKQCRSFNVAVDVGAHVGLISSALANRFKRVIAFEPIPENYDLLTENVPDNVECFNMALGNTYGTMSATNPAPENSGAWELNTDDGDIKVAPLDSLHLDALDLMKIDTQGMELDVLKGAQDTITRLKPVIWYEVPKGSKLDNDESAFLYNECGMRNAIIIGNKNVIGYWP